MASSIQDVISSLVSRVLVMSPNICVTHSYINGMSGDSVQRGCRPTTVLPPVGLALSHRPSAPTGPSRPPRSACRTVADDQEDADASGPISGGVLRHRAAAVRLAADPDPC